MSEEYDRISGELDIALKSGFGSSTPMSITDEGRTRLLIALTAANEKWPVVPDRFGEQFLLDWSDESPGLSEMGRLAEATAILQDAGIPVERGRSGRGYTYINIRLWEVADVFDIEETDDEDEDEDEA
jgi:hypothetical protein